MQRNDVLYLIREDYEPNDIGDMIATETRRQVFAEIGSVGLRRKVDAMAAGLKPELKFVLADAAEYEGEEIIEYDGARYNVVHSYIMNSGKVELLVKRY